MLERALEAARRDGAWPMASLWVWARGQVFEAHVGGAGPETTWDLASLTKPMGVGTIAMEAVSRGEIELDAVIEGFEPVGSDGSAREASPLTWRRLLGHRAGLPAWKDLVFALPEPRVVGSEAARYAVRALVRMAARERDGARGVEYSDLGYLLAGMLLEERLGRSLVEGAVGGVYRPEVGARTLAPTGWCPWRGRAVAPGEVHDPNAWVLGGVAGHAGLFGTAAEVGEWARGLLWRSQGRATGGRLDAIAPEVLREFWSLDERGVDGAGRPATWVLGWDTPSAVGSSAGRWLSPGSVGHLGFTGTSVWIDRRRELVVVLLSNRVALGAAAIPAIKRARPAVHDAVIEAIFGTDETGGPRTS